MQTQGLNVSLSPLKTHKSLDQNLLRLAFDSPQRKKNTNFGASGIGRSSSSMASFSSIIGDYMGVKSCLDLNNDGDILASSSSSKKEENLTSNTRGRLSKREVKKKQHFPPPITMLARTENYSSRMPWVLKKHYTGDGRLVLTGEKVKHYLQAHRSNGRLTLQFIPRDNGDDNYQDPPLVDGKEDYR